MFLEKNDIYVSCCCLTGRYMSYFHFNVLVSLFYFLFLNVMWLSNDDALTTTHSRPPLQYVSIFYAFLRPTIWPVGFPVKNWISSSQKKKRKKRPLFSVIWHVVLHFQQSFAFQWAGVRFRTPYAPEIHFFLFFTDFCLFRAICWRKK